MKHWKYLRYLLRHRWFVFFECVRLGIVWRGIVHDLSKFRWDEWEPYAEFFYGKKRDREWFEHGGVEGEVHAPYGTYVKEQFNLAWLRHIHRNPHHWQYWVLREDDGPRLLMPMPDQYRREMVADWIGAGKAQRHDLAGNDPMSEVQDWYKRNSDKMLLREETRGWVEEVLKRR